MQRAHKKEGSGFSLVELMLAMSITLIVGMIVFEMFRQNEGVFRDQTLVMEMQQSTRAVASMIADEVQLAGQGVPLYSAAQDTSTSEAVQTFLDGTDAANLRFRAGIRNASTPVTTPLAYSGTTAVTIADVTGVNNIVGMDPKYFVYLWGPTSNTWTLDTRRGVGHRPGDQSALCSLEPEQRTGCNFFEPASPGSRGRHILSTRQRVCPQRDDKRFQQPYLARVHRTDDRDTLHRFDFLLL